MKRFNIWSYPQIFLINSGLQCQRRRKVHSRTKSGTFPIPNLQKPEEKKIVRWQQFDEGQRFKVTLGEHNNFQQKQK